MKICLVSQEYPPETAKGGIGTQTYIRAHGLSELGHEMFVISHSTDQSRREVLDGSVRVTRIPGFDSRLPIHAEPARWLTYSAEVAVAVAELNRRVRLDLVVFPEYGAEGFVHLLNQTEWNHIPTIVHIHGPLVMFAHTMKWPDLDSELFRVGTMMEATCLRLADGISASANCSAEWCAAHYLVPRDRIVTLYSGIDTATFSPRGVAKAQQPTIIFIGGIVRNKGVDLLVDAACRLLGEFPNLRLRMFGRGDPKLVSEIKAMAASSAHPQFLELGGYIAREHIPEELSRAHVFAGPARYEGGPGNVYLEAMACGIPVVACHGSGSAEMIRPGQNGILVPPDDPDALAAALREILSIESLRDSMGSWARSFVLREADSKDCLIRIEKFYREVAGRRRASGAEH